MKKIKKSAIIVIGVVVLTLIVMQMSGFFRDKVQPDVADHQPRLAPKDAQFAVAQSLTQPVFEEASGTVQAASRTMISARIMAAIREVHVRAGDYVSEGDVLVTLDDRQLQSQAAQAGEGLNSAQAQLDNAKQNFDRQQNLFKEGVTTKRDFDAAEAAFRVAEANVQRAKQTVEEMQVALTYTQIKAPVSGRVVERLAEPGDTASPGSPLLQLYDPNALQLEAPVRESLAMSLSVGDELKVRIDALQLELAGKVSEIVPQAEVGSRVFRVKVALPAQKKLYTGMYGRLAIPVGERDMIILAPEAVHTIGQNSFVEVANDKNELERRLITLGAVAPNGQIEILSGLNPDERIMVE
ncbi:efflux RND transporter periplasmic adaptor subunit [Candidatus Sumerlaeota bacterium]|nr:efflux RND transporter periplasmic adaptor subunit [Candidatus Sumerlaeota bacterium]